MVDIPDRAVPSDVYSWTTTIANGASLSSVVDLTGYTLVGVQIPSSWTAAGITFSVSADGTTYADLYKDDGTEYALTVAASQFIRITPIDLAGIRWLKLRSGTSGTPVNQGAERSIMVVGRKI